MWSVRISRRSLLSAGAVLLPIGVASMTIIGPSSGRYGPDHDLISYTDHSGVSVDGGKARFLRPGNFSNYEHCAPGSRVRLRSDAPRITLHCYYNNLNADGAYADGIGVFVDGAPYSDHSPTESRTAFYYDITLDLGSSQPRTIEVIMPYAAGVDFLGITQGAMYRLFRPLDRPATKLMVVGDSITHGFSVTDTRRSWPFLLAQTKGWQLVNMGFGSARVSSHGSADYAAGIAPNITAVLLGYNNFADQTALLAFKGGMTTLLNGLLAGTIGTVYVITPTWSSNTNTITLANYRTAINEAVTAISSERLVVIDGLSLATNSTAHYPDGVHPNDAGAEAMATALAAVIAP